MEIKQNSPKAWLLAARPKTLSGAAVPVMIAVVLAWQHEPDAFQWLPAVLCLLFAFVMQVDANFVNDYFDFKRGNDDETRLGPKRACAEGWVTLRAMAIAITLTTLLACAIGLPLIIYGGWQMIAVGVACVVFCFLYTTCLSYLAMGDLLVLVFFGLVPVCCTYWVCLPASAHALTPQVVACAVASGLVIDTLLIVNNFRDHDNDQKAHKRTLIVLIGKPLGAWLYLACGIVAALLAASTIPTPAMLTLMLLYAARHCYTWQRMRRIWQGAELNSILAETSLNMLAFAILFVVATLIHQL